MELHEPAEVDIPNVLADRYASMAMRALWAPRHKVVLERRLWLAVLRAQRQLGLADVPEQAIADYEAVLEEVDLDSIAQRETLTRHDVKARIDEFCALAKQQHIHRGMTSRDLTENIEQVRIRDSLLLISHDLVAVIARLAELAEANSDLVLVARTHNVAAQATTLGKRFADALEESLLGLERLEELLARYPLRGMKGPVGTRQDQLDILGSETAVEQLERLLAEQLGFDRVLDACGQVYPRSLDLDVVSALVQAVSAASSLALTIRLMAGHELVSEAFRDGQVGSSAMPHKMNARSAERVAALRTVLDGHLTMAAGLAGRQWNEGDVSCSALRRVLLPDAFFAADGLLHTALDVFDGLVVFEAALAAELQRDLPFLATTRLLSGLVESGMGREQAHEVLQEHALAVVQARRAGSELDLLMLLANDPRVVASRSELAALLSEPTSLTGTAASQTANLVKRARLVTERYPPASSRSAEVRV